VILLSVITTLQNQISINKIPSNKETCKQSDLLVIRNFRKKQNRFKIKRRGSTPKIDMLPQSKTPSTK